MSETKWTKGPWSVHRSNMVTVDADRHGAIAQPLYPIHWRSPECDDMYVANAHLIAAAPELYAALEGLEEAYCRAGDGLTKAERHEDRMRLIAARAARAKARGEQ